MRSLSAAAALVAAATLTIGTLTACSSSDSSDGTRSDGAISLQNCGREVVMDAPATRAITVNQGATESALAIDAGGDLVGTAYLDDAIAPQYREAYDAIPVLAEKYPSLETVIAEEPDLVLASYASAFEEEGIGSRDELADLDIATYVSPFGCADRDQRPDASWDAIADEVTDYGVLFGRGNDADAVNKRMRDTLAELNEQRAGDGVSIVWWDGGTDTPSVGAADGGPGLIMDAVGATNVFGDLSGNWADTSWERVVDADPDLIVLIDANWSTADSKRAYLEADPVLRNLKAVREQSYVVIPFSESTPGARTIDGATTLADHLADR